MQVKAFPWPAKSVDLGGIVAGILFNFLLVFAFQQPTRSMVAVIVREKELRLREYMRVLGLLDAAYWGAWFVTHMAVLCVTGLLCALIGTCAPPPSTMHVPLARRDGEGLPHGCPRLARTIHSVRRQLQEHLVDGFAGSYIQKHLTNGVFWTCFLHLLVRPGLISTIAFVQNSSEPSTQLDTHPLSMLTVLYCDICALATLTRFRPVSDGHGRAGFHLQTHLSS
jgi:hypothetical protein